MHTAALRLASSSRSTALAVSKSAKTCQTTWIPRRRLHMRKGLPYKIEDGLGNFMSSRTLQMVAVEYQQGLLDRLNQECRDVEDKRKTVAQLVLDTARSQDRAVMFAYASHALNNSFFLHSLRPPSDDTGEKRVDASVLGTQIRKQFGGFDSLRALFSAAANGMAGSGYVWLVADTKQNLAFVPTFASGTLLIRSSAGTVEPITTPVLGEDSLVHPSSSPTDSSATSTPASSASSPLSGVSHVPPQLDPSSPARAFHTSVLSANSYKTRTRSFYDPTAPPISPIAPQDPRDLTTLGEYIYPLFCISVHEHCWLLDHGIWGKERYLKEFWSVVDWSQVVKRFETFTTTTI